MARNHTKPRYWKSRGGYYVTLHGTQVLLAKGKKDDPEVKRLAKEKFYEVLHGGKTPREGKVVREPSSGELVEAYLSSFFSTATATNTAIITRRYLQKFLASPFSSLLPQDIPPVAFKEWVELSPTWSSSTRRLCCVTVFKALGREACPKPLRAVCRHYSVPSRARGKVNLITDTVHTALYEAANKTTKPVLLALHDTGARPNEILQLTAQMYDPHLHAFLPDKLKVKKKHRTIYLTPVLEEVALSLIFRYPTGPLFCNKYGNPMELSGLQCWFRKKRKLLGLGPVTPYLYRHKFCTDFLLKGGSMVVLASLVGSSVPTLLKHYSHVGEHSQELLEHVRRFRGVV